MRQNKTRKDKEAMKGEVKTTVRIGLLVGIAAVSVVTSAFADGNVNSSVKKLDVKSSTVSAGRCADVVSADCLLDARSLAQRDTKVAAFVVAAASKQGGLAADSSMAKNLGVAGGKFSANKVLRSETPMIGAPNDGDVVFSKELDFGGLKTAGVNGSGASANNDLTGLKFEKSLESIEK